MPSQSERFEPSDAQINALLDPNVIAVIGASPDTFWSRNLFGGFNREGFKGRIYTVNPGRGKVMGFPAYESIAALPEVPDFAMILLGAKLVPDILEELADKGCRAAYVLAAGYEAADRLAALRSHANKLGMLILGPNCNGYIRPDPGLHCWVGPIPRPYQSGALAFVAQSSAVAGSACNSAWDRGLGFSAIISTGNQCNFSLAEALKWLAGDLDTRAIVCYIEQFADLPAFAEGVRRCRAAGKAVIAIATGQSEAARQITLSHTGALTAGPEASAAALEAMGVIQADELDDALDYASLFVQLPPRAWRPIKTVGVVTASGGYSALAADALEKYGLRCPPPPRSVIKTLPPIVPHNNPMDLTATIFAWADQFPKVIDAFVEAEQYDAVAVMFGAWEGLERWFAPVSAWAYRAKKPVFLAGNEVMALGDDMRRYLARDPLPVVHGAGRVARALAGMKLYHELEPRIGPEWASAKPRRWRGPKVATYPALAPALEKQGITMAAWRNLGAGESADKLGQTVAVKLESPALPHKTEAGAVQGGVAQTDLERAVRRLEGIAQRRKLDDYAIIAQEMIGDTELELLVGAVVDDNVGPILTVGLGGITAELLQQTAQALCPIDAGQARKLIAKLGILPLFEGYRARPPLDDSIFDLLSAVSHWVYDHRNSLRELDLNPVFVRARGNPAVAGDALAVFS